MNKKQKRVMMIIRLLPEEKQSLKFEALKKNISLTEWVLTKLGIKK